MEPREQTSSGARHQPDPAPRSHSEPCESTRSDSCSDCIRHPGSPDQPATQELSRSKASSRSEEEREDPLLRTLQPVPSLQLLVAHQGQELTITLDSGATVSFCTPALVQRLGLTIQPNSQLALLADQRYRVRSKGEVDFLVVERTTKEALLRVRALVMDNLGVDCYGGQTFHLDNAVSGDVSGGQVYLHGGRFTVRQETHGANEPKPPPAQSVHEMPAMRGAAAAAVSGSGTVLMKLPRYLLPSGVYPIPTTPTTFPTASSVLVLPPAHRQPSQAGPDWQPQICEVVEGAALYVNRSPTPLHHPKLAHFKTVPMVETSTHNPSTPHPRPVTASRAMVDKANILDQIKVNTDLLSQPQQECLLSIHTANMKAFDEDMTGGYRNKEHPYLATFTFREENMAPPYKIWVPQFNRRCQDLMQSKCDQLEQQGVLVDPKVHGIDIRHVSPCFIQQKGRAKHKQLDDCSLDEVRFISCFNVLNESIHPIPGRSNSYNDILKFLGRHKFFIFADLTSSYFQIMVHKRLWRYLGVMTPFRGIKVMTRLGQGLLNSDVELDQAMAQVLGDEMTAGFCCVARDDLCIGGDSIDECIGNWGRVLAKLNSNNLKLSPGKVRALLQDTEVFGHRVKDGKVRPSDHIVTSLGKTCIDELKTVRQVNSWKGLYKTLIRHLPHLATQMVPFDTACASKSSTSTFDWSQPGLVAAFNSATKHLEQVRETYLPHPGEQLVLMPDTSTSNLCTGWVLYTERSTDKGKVWLPVQYASAKLHKYMSSWTPCEQEAVGAVLAIDQVRHWINESRLPTMVLPDNKPVADAANMMKIGRHSRNARLQSLLNSVNRSSVTFTHNSAKAGHHIVPDALSRVSGPACRAKDCQVERFLRELPDRVQCMGLTLEGLALSSTTPAMLAATTTEMGNMVSLGAGPIPLGSRQAWIGLQADCNDCWKFLECKRLGQVPGRKDKDKTVLNKLVKRCEVDRGLIVSKEFDPTIMRESVKTYVPTNFLLSILTVMHTRLSHPPASQLQKIFERYFVALGVRGACVKLTEDCSLCVAVRRFPRELETYSPAAAPAHPGTHMNTDVLRRASQLIVVNCDRFSNFTTAAFAPSETREDMARAILAVVTPIRHGARVEVRTDRATALQSLANRPDQQLQENGIDLVLGDHGNPNSNCSVDKAIQELEAELRRLSPDGGKLDLGTLSRAVTSLNNKVREHGLSASQIHFSRDSHTGTNLSLSDKRLKENKEERKAKTNPATAKSKARGAKEHVRVVVEPGDMVYMKSDGDKHTARDPLMVTAVKEKKVTVQKVLHATPQHRLPPKITSQKLEIDEKFLYVPPHKRSSPPPPPRPSDNAWWRGRHQVARRKDETRRPEEVRRPEEAWIPVDPPDFSEDYLEVELRPGGRAHRAATIPPRPPEEQQRQEEEQQQQRQEEERRQEEQEQQQEEERQQYEKEQKQREEEQRQYEEDQRQYEEGKQEEEQRQERRQGQFEKLWQQERRRRRLQELVRRPEEQEQLQEGEHLQEQVVVPAQEQEEEIPPRSPRRRLRGTSEPASRDARRRQTPVVRSASIRPRDRPVVRPKASPDIEGRLVTEHELIKYNMAKPGDTGVRWQLATVTRMFKKQQQKSPTYYNVQTSGQTTVTKSVELLPGGTWMVWRTNRWWSSSEGRPPPDAQALEEQEEREEEPQA